MKTQIITPYAGAILVTLDALLFLLFTHLELLLYNEFGDQFI